MSEQPGFSRFAPVEHLVRDVRYAARLLRQRPVLSATAILTLMLGLGATTAVFSLFDALVVRQLPVTRPEQLIRLVERRSDGRTAEAFTLVTHDLLQHESQSFSGLAASSILAGPSEIDVAGQRERAVVQLVSDSYFDILGIQASIGRVFHERKPGTAGEPVAVISEEYWQRRYGGDRSAIGQTFRRRLAPFTIAGVAPRGFRGIELDTPVDIWIPVDQVLAPNAPDRTQGRWMRMIGRLRPEVPNAQAEAEVSAVVGRQVQILPGGTGYSALRLRLMQPLRLLALVVFLVLLIACANLANLMLAATLSRGREIAVRAAIGASRGRIIRQLLTESFMLAAIGAALGIGVAYWISSALLSFLPPEQAVAVPNLRFTLNGRALGFTTVLSIATCLLFGVMPAVRASGEHTATSLKAGAGTGQRHHRLLGRGLLVGQVLMCTTLLMVAWVFGRTVMNLRGQDAGYREDRLLVADVGFPREYPDARRDQLIEELRARVAALPEVEAAAFSHVGQLSGAAMEWRIGFSAGEPARDTELEAIEQRVSPGFFRAMGTPLIAGREFTPSDDDRAPLVAIVNESFARQFFPARDPIGGRFFREGGTHSGELMEIVGVVKDSKWTNLRDDRPSMYYRPYRQMGGTPVVRLAIRTFGAPESVARDLVGLARSVDPAMVLNNVVPFGEIVNRTLVIERLIAQVSSAFGGLALLIAAVGLYGILAYSVVRRRREIGLRIAVGAQPLSIEMMFLREAVSAVAIGVIVGIPLAIAVTRSVSSMLFGLSPHDAASIGLVSATLILVAVAAAYVPARAAARTDPLVALRDE